jgi:hypothetical protein
VNEDGPLNSAHSRRVSRLSLRLLGGHAPHLAPADEAAEGTRSFVRRHASHHLLDTPLAPAAEATEPGWALGPATPPPRASASNTRRTRRHTSMLTDEPADRSKTLHQDRTELDEDADQDQDTHPLQGKPT